MKTHKLISAVLALACALTLSVSCGKNSDNAQESQPSAVLMSFISDYTEDMLDYCDIQVTFDNGKSTYQTIVVTKEILDDQLKLKCMLGSDTLPAILTISRKVKLKEDISSLESFTYTKAHSYQFAIYDVKGDRVYLSDFFSEGGSVTGPGDKVGQLISDGGLDQEFSFHFTETGELK